MARARLHHRIGRHREWHPIHHHQATRQSAYINTLPQRHGADQTRVRVSGESLHQLRELALPLGQHFPGQFLS